MSSLPGVLLQLIELLAQDDLTVADVVARVGPIARDPGPPLDVELAPVSPELVSATVTRHRQSGAPYLLNIEPAMHERSTLGEWSAVLGSYQRLRSDIGHVIKTIVDDETAFPDYALPKKSAGPKKSGAAKSRTRSKRPRKT